MAAKLRLDKFVSLSESQCVQLGQLASGLLYSTQDAARDVIGRLVALAGQGEDPQTRDQAYREASAVVQEQLVNQLAGAQSSHKSQFIEYLSLVNQLPLPGSSDAEKQLKAILTRDRHYHKDFEAGFNLLAALHLLTGLGVYDAAESLMPRFEARGGLECEKLNLVYQITKARIMQHKGDAGGFMAIWLQMIHRIFQEEGSQVALYLVIRWIRLLNWEKETYLKKNLLERLDEELANQRNLLTATVLYELFILEDKLVSPERKMQYVKRLIGHPVALLNCSQLQVMYFFAGNYVSGMQSAFMESIQYFKYSNYYLHKFWDFLYNYSQFLRENLETDEYMSILPFMENRMLVLGSQVSLQNNAYVETLQADYNKIEELLKQVEQLSVTDSLTGLKNRRHLETAVYQMFLLAVRHRVEVCFAMVDIDHFKQVNDTHGHQAGDFVLKELASVISRDFRKSDVILRYGGEEFLLVLFDSGLERTRLMMEELRADIEGHLFEFKGQSIPVTVSIGVSCFYDTVAETDDLTRMIAVADKALYQAKNAGRNQVAVCEY
jgi:diguanylate cyclase (GGDEF)-like protein